MKITAQQSQNDANDTNDAKNAIKRKGVNPMYYHECPECGSTLDPNEKCDCDSGQNAHQQTDGKTAGEHRDIRDIGKALR